MKYNYVLSALSSETLKILPAAEMKIWEDYLYEAVNVLLMPVAEAVATLPDVIRLALVKDEVIDGLYKSEFKASFLPHVGSLVPTGCIPYVGKLKDSGYGPHRKAYKKFFGEIPAGLVVDHMCNNRNCLNPAHMALTTIARNSGRAKMKAECQNGHMMAVTANKYGRCTECRAEKRRIATAAKKAGTWVSPVKRNTETHCANGLPLEEVTWYTRPNGQKECMHCRRLQTRRRDAALKVLATV